MAKSKSLTTAIPSFLVDLLNARSPSGYEFEAQAVLDQHMKGVAEVYDKDALGNRMAMWNVKGPLTVMLAGHMDELGLIITYIDERGFLYFDTIGGHDNALISGRRVEILTEKGVVRGITGKRAVHLMLPEERKKTPELHELWIDIGAKDKKEALNRVSIGDVAVYDQSFMPLEGSLAVARAFDDKAGCYVVMEVLKRVAKAKKKLYAKLVSVATTQEEIGVRGATTAAYHVNPDIAIAVDVTHATDHPTTDPKRHGSCQLGAGPMICRGPNINPMVFDQLIRCAKDLKIPYQVEADARPTGTDARVLQMARSGVATGLVSIPLRYMHTPSEMVDLNDIEATVELLVAFVSALGSKSPGKGDMGALKMHW